MLEDEPRLLLFTPSVDGKVLENGRARAEVRHRPRLCCTMTGPPHLDGSGLPVSVDIFTVSCS